MAMFAQNNESTCMENNEGKLGGGSGDKFS